MKMQVDFYAGRLNVTIARSDRRIGRWIDRNVPAGDNCSLGATVQWPQPRNSPAAVLALCYDRRCILIQLCYLSGLPKRLLRLLRSPSVTLAGIWNGHDGAKLLQQNSDLQLFGPGFNFLPDASITKSDWRCRNLSRNQVRQASVEAAACFQLAVQI
ncbi:unnamed protein product [Brassica napus]|uniref:(rape) hypothetical protein n=1 Tax=Brassica napus TaxID=3708 RepID=A0A816KJ61_BRANA|nr:unnamed protein product [Brassica napus]